jgi:hypothetical protein
MELCSVINNGGELSIIAESIEGILPSSSVSSSSSSSSYELLLSKEDPADNITDDTLLLRFQILMI